MSRTIEPAPVTPPTLADVAERAGVSRQTVSNAVNNPDLLRAGHPAARPAGDRRARLPAQPRGPQPAHPRLAPDRAADQGRRGGHRQRGDGPVRALPGRGLARGRLPRAALLRLQHRQGRGRAARLRRPAALDRRGRVRGHRHLPRQPPGRLAERPAGAVRRVRTAVERPRGAPPVGGRRRRGRRRHGHLPPDRARPPPDRLDRLAQGLAARRGPPGRAGRARCAPARSRPPGWPPGSRTPWRPDARRAPCCSTRPSPRPSSAPPTPWRWASCTPCPSAGCGPATTSRSPASTTPRSPRPCRPG